MLRGCLLLLAISMPASPALAADNSLLGFSSEEAERQHALETEMVKHISTEDLRRWIEHLAAEPHHVGSEYGVQNANFIASLFKEWGYETTIESYEVLVPTPSVRIVELIEPETYSASLTERIVEGDASTRMRDAVLPPYNAFSPDGDVSAELVYVNYGIKADYELLERHGIDVVGKIVIARYGGNFRGYKCKFAEADGAVGLIIYTDPKDSGWGKGLPYPEGGYANGTYIQRGSILTLDYRGDPLTPGRPATEHAERLDPKDVAFPKIPCQPIGWDAAKQILGRMKGASVPDDWQGGLPFRYRLTGGADLKVRVMVKQERKLTRTYNVTGTLKGRLYPDHVMVVGAHHDAWGFGAGDPTAGTIIVMEAARCFAEAARNGQRPARSIVFAAWAAEEYGIMGSTEWVEAHQRDLSQNCIAYLNLDMAAMGPNLRSRIGRASCRERV